MGVALRGTNSVKKFLKNPLILKYLLSFFPTIYPEMYREVHTQRGTNTTFVTLKRYEEPFAPVLFYMGVPPLLKVQWRFPKLGSSEQVLGMRTVARLPSEIRQGFRQRLRECSQPPTPAPLMSIFFHSWHISKTWLSYHEWSLITYAW